MGCLIGFREVAGSACLVHSSGGGVGSHDAIAGARAPKSAAAASRASRAHSRARRLGGPFDYKPTAAGSATRELRRDPAPSVAEASASATRCCAPAGGWWPSSSGGRLSASGATLLTALRAWHACRLQHEQASSESKAGWLTCSAGGRIASSLRRGSLRSARMLDDAQSIRGGGRLHLRGRLAAQT